jgi:hypothetical protein
VSPVYHLHPDFGLLCPSPTFRRRTRVALACLAVVIIAAALVIKFGHEPGADGALLIAHGDAAGTSAESGSTVGQDTTTDETSPAPEASAAACEGDPSSRSDATCGAGKVRKLKSRRAANEGAIIGALPLGRIALVAPEPSAAAPTATDVANSDVPAPAVADPPAPRAPKKVRKASRRSGGRDWSREWSLPASQWSARAYAPDNRYLRGRDATSWGRSW